jgi:uncharacterized membrane protein
MVTSNKDLMTQAREALSGRWGLALGTFILYMLIMAASGTVFIGTLLIGGAFAVGISTFCLSIARKEEARLEMIFSGFKNFGNALILYLLIAIFVFLWTLLLIIPGIIAQISYAMAYFIMSDEPNIGAMDAINKSKKMMYGYKWKYFCLCCRFIGWFILGVLSLGIGFLWIVPYLNISFAEFYEDVKANFVEVQ